MTDLADTEQGREVLRLAAVVLRAHLMQEASLTTEFHHELRRMWDIRVDGGFKRVLDVVLIRGFKTQRVRTKYAASAIGAAMIACDQLASGVRPHTPSGKSISINQGRLDAREAITRAREALDDYNGQKE